MTGYVYLVGAGPGDARLISIKGLEAVRKADVIVYDHLACTSLMNEAREGTKLIYAGKKAGLHAMKQTEISALLVSLAREGHTVVRLKGGDPFIFGRGGEEALILQENGIGYEVIPGISSCYCAPESAGIPVTHRGLASSFHVITGHEDPAKGISQLDYSVLAKEEGTLIFLMGLSRAGKICDTLIRYGKDPKTPAAVISNGTTVYQRTVRADLATLGERILEEGIKPPAILVIGDVVSLERQLYAEDKRPLSGKRILVTAYGQTAENLAGMIRELGGEPVMISLIGIHPADQAGLSDKLREAPDDAWLVFTSRNGVHQFFRQLMEEKMDLRTLGKKRIAVLGRGTAAALAEHGYYPDLVPEKACSESLAEALRKQILINDKDHDSARVLFFRAQESSPVPVEVMAGCGIDYEDIALYRTTCQTEKKELLCQVLESVDIVTFCSASAVKAFAGMSQERSPEAKTVFIGPVSAKAAEKAGLRVDCTAERYDLYGLMAAVQKAAEG